jgi:hypothetical protein
MGLANELRAYVDQHLLFGSPAGRELLVIADKIDSLEGVASPVGECGDRPCVAEDDQP